MLEHFIVRSKITNSCWGNDIIPDNQLVETCKVIKHERLRVIVSTFLFPPHTVLIHLTPHYCTPLFSTKPPSHPRPPFTQMDVFISKWVLLASLVAAVPGVWKLCAQENSAHGEWGEVVRAWDGERTRWGAMQQMMVHDYRADNPHNNSAATTSPHEALYLNPTDIDTTSKTIPPYTPLIYKTTGLPSTFLEPLIGWREIHANLTYTTARQSVYRHLASVPLSVSEEIRTANWKQCQFSYKGSLFEQTRCVRYKVLSKMCVLMRFDAEVGLWVPGGFCPDGLKYDVLKVGKRNSVPLEFQIPDTFVLEARLISDPLLRAPETHPVKAGESRIIEMSATVSTLIFIIWVVTNVTMYVVDSPECSYSTEVYRPKRDSYGYNPLKKRKSLRRRA